MHPVFARQRRKVFRGPTGLGNSPRNRGKLLTPDEGPEAGGRKSHRKSGILEEEDEEEEGEGEEDEVQEIKHHQTHGRHSRMNSEDIAVISEDAHEENVIADHSPGTVGAGATEQKQRQSGYFGKAAIGGDKGDAASSPLRESWMR